MSRREHRKASGVHQIGRQQAGCIRCGLTISQHLQRATVGIQGLALARDAQYRMRIAFREQGELPAFGRFADVGAQG